ncbi:MAG: hypothetical protein WAO35_10185 [Terriglobia bacterium]
MFQDIKASLQQLYRENQRPWQAGFSGNVGPSSARPGPKALRPYKRRDPVAPAEQVRRPVYRALSGVTAALSTVYRMPSTVFSIPAIAEMIEGTLDRMRKCSEQNNLNIDANLLKPLIEESFWVNIIGRGYPPPNRTFRWCTQRMKIDPVNALVKQRVGHWGEAILHLGARRAESSTLG